jgi:hypothetical protein
MTKRRQASWASRFSRVSQCAISCDIRSDPAPASALLRICSSALPRFTARDFVQMKLFLLPLFFVLRVTLLGSI